MKKSCFSFYIRKEFQKQIILKCYAELNLSAKTKYFSFVFVSTIN